MLIKINRKACENEIIKSIKYKKEVKYFWGITQKKTLEILSRDSYALQMY